MRDRAGEFFGENEENTNKRLKYRYVEGLEFLPAPNTIFAELGSLNLEFTRLTQLTGDPKYYDAVQRIANFLEESQNNTALPGMWPVTVDARSKSFFDTHFTVGGMADSSYEYLPKEHILLGGHTDQYGKMYTTAIDTIKENLLFRAMTKDGRDAMFAGNGRVVYIRKKPSLEYQTEHLKCYLGATIGVGAKVFDRPQELSLARMLTEGCIWAYDIMPTGIMPEIFHVAACRDLEKCSWDEIKWFTEVRSNSRRASISNDAVAEGRSTAREKGIPPGIVSISDAQYHLRYFSLVFFFFFIF